MPRDMTFEPNTPFTTKNAAVIVDRGLRPGQYRFQLIVVGRDGRRSEPVEVVVEIRDERDLVRDIVRSERGIVRGRNIVRRERDI